MHPWAAMADDDDWEGDAAGTGDPDGDPPEQAAMGSADGSPMVRNRSRGRGANGRGRGRGGRGNGTPKALCLVQDCQKPRHANTKWCQEHKRSYDAMRYRADTDADPEAKEIWEKLNQTEEHVAEEVRLYSIDNPPSAKYARKGLIQWAGYKRKYGIRVTRRDRSSDIPMWEGEFLKWATETKCLPEEEAKEWWKEMKDDPSVVRDHKGRGGRLQLFVPGAVVARERLRDRFIENEEEEGSAPVKKAKTSDIEELRKHVDRQDVDFANEFLADSRATPVKKKAGGGALMASPGEVTPTGKKIELEREVPKFGQQVEKEVKTLVSDFGKGWRNVEKAVEIMATTTLPLNDQASHLYKNTLQFRKQIGHRFLGEPDVVVVLGKGAGAMPSDSKAAAVGEAGAAGGKVTANAQGEVKQDSDKAVEGKAAALKAAAPGEEAAEKPAGSGKTETAAASAEAGGAKAPAPSASSEASFNMTFANAPAQAVDSYKAAVRGMSLKQLLEANRKSLPFEGAAEDFLIVAEMKKFSHDAYGIDSAEKLVEERLRWARVMKVARSFIRHLGKASQDMIAHVKTLETKNRMEKEQAIREQQRQEIARVKAEAEVQANRIRSRQKKAVEYPLYSIDLTEARAPLMKAVIGDNLDELEMDTPCLVKQSESMQLWLTERKVSTALTSFAAQYKKSKDCIANGRVQFPLQDNCGKMESNDFMRSWCKKAMDIHGVDGGPSFMESVWFFGVAPGNEKLTVPHNCAAAAKALVCGEILAVVINVSSLMEVVKGQGLTGYSSLENLLASIEAWDGKAMDEFRAAGVVMQQCTLRQNEVIYVPMGWLLLEKASSSSPLVYGVRKSFMIATAESKKGYAFMHDLFEADKRNVSRMADILSRMG